MVHYGPLFSRQGLLSLAKAKKNTYHHHVDATSLNLPQLGVGHTIGHP